MNELPAKALALRDAIKGALDALSVAMVAADDLADMFAEADRRRTPATDAERRQVAALRKLLGQPGVDGVAMTHGQAEHEIKQWTAEAERRPATAEQQRVLGELAAALTLDGIKVHDIPQPLSVAGYVRERRFLESLRKDQHTAGAAK